MNDEDALKFLIKCLREPIWPDYPNYGYDIYLPNIIRSYLRASGAKLKAP